jgi:hypothetical protein
MDDNLGRATLYISSVGAHRVDSGLDCSAFCDCFGSDGGSNVFQVVVFGGGSWPLEHSVYVGQRCSLVSKKTPWHSLTCRKGF